PPTHKVSRLARRRHLSLMSASAYVAVPVGTNAPLEGSRLGAPVTTEQPQTDPRISTGRRSRGGPGYHGASNRIILYCFWSPTWSTARYSPGRTVASGWPSARRFQTTSLRPAL